MTLAELRALIPGARELTWLNAAASSPLPTPVAAAMRSVIDDAEHHGDLSFNRWLALRERLRAQAASLVGTEAANVALLPSTSAGMGVVAHLLRARGISEVLTLEGEFPSTTVPLLHAGLTLRVVRKGLDGTFSLDSIRSALTSQTGAMAVSVVQYASGYRVDLAGVSQLAKDTSLPLILNAAQALGQVPMHMRELGASFVLAPSHKWLMGSWGLAIVAIADEWLDLPKPNAGWLSVPDALMWHALPGAQVTADPRGLTARGAIVRREASALEVGGFPVVAYAALSAALELHAALDAKTVLKHNQTLQLQLREGLRRRGFRPNTPDELATLSGICVIPVEGPAIDAVKVLLAQKVVTTPRGDGLRLSTHLFNVPNDVAAALDAIDTTGIRPVT
jgi:cysteine desulfurase / selenocysteine lyase